MDPLVELSASESYQTQNAGNYGAFVTKYVFSSAPANVSVTPSSGSGISAAFTFQYFDPNGASDLSVVSALFGNSASNLASSCAVMFNRAQNTLSLLTDSGAPPSVTVAPGTATAQNSQCVLNDGASSVSLSGNILSLTLALTFQPESVAVVGRNGAGKSTLLSLVAGLTQPVQGKVTVRGRTAALLELGAGFHPDLTGLESLRLNASLLGLSRGRTAEVFDSIVAFADIGDFIYEPIRTYSMGMTMRLAFAVAIHVDPDILIVDEVLAIGDQAFQEKCQEGIRRFKQEGKTLLFVSHSGPLVGQLCERAIWLERGHVLRDGPAGDVLAAYAAYSAQGD